MKIIILTLFPTMFEPFLNTSIIKRAINNQKVNFEIVNFRDYAQGKHQQVDDTPYGGGGGMVLMLQPIVTALKQYPNSYKILLCPSGHLLTQQRVKQLGNHQEILLICGHYEGFDARIYHYIDDVISIGNFVLTGGELPAMIISDALTRLIPGVINAQSLQHESFEAQMLDYPNYTKPAVFEQLSVPEILLSGHHSKIEKWRHEQAIQKTYKYRPDLLKD